MIDWRDMHQVFDSMYRSIEMEATIGSCVEVARAVACFAVRDYDGAAEHEGRALGLGAKARELREMRTEWKRLDQWADDGGRV